MTRICLLQLLVIAFVWGAPHFPQASILQAMSLDELVASSDHVVVAKVASVSAAWNVTHTRIGSTIEVDVEEVWKGKATPGQRLTIVQPGGTVGEVEMTVHGMPAFVSGEAAVLFLQGRARLAVVGMAQGKKGLQWDETSRRWFTERPLPNGTRPAAQSGGARVSLEELRVQVRAATRR